MKPIKKTLVPMVALLLVSSMLLLPSCGSTYQVTMDGWENKGDNPSPDPEGGKELSLPDMPSLPEKLPPAQSLLPEKPTDPITDALKDLLDMEQYTDAGFVGFSADLRYFVADFRGTLLEEQYGAGCYLLMLNETITPETLAGICQKLKAQGIYDQLFQVEKAKELINEGLSKLEKTPELKELILCYFDEETMGKISEFLATEQGGALLCLYRPVKAPVEGYPLRNPAECTEPQEKYSTKWLEWLANTDNGTTYTRVWDGKLWDGANYSLETTHSAWELWPYNGEDDTVEENSHFCLLPCLAQNEIDATENIGTEEYAFSWKVYYREEGSGEEFKCVQAQPWSSVPFAGYSLYRIDLYSAGMTDLKLKEDGSASTYEMIFIIFDEEGNQLVWRRESVKWTDSSEAFLNKAIEHGVVEGTAPVDPCPEVEPEPGLVYP